MANKITDLLKNLSSNSFLKGSAFLFIGSMVVNFGNYLFQLLLGKFLGPAEYANFVTLVSLAYFSAIPSMALQTFIAKTSAEFFISDETDRIKFLLYKILKNIFILSSVFIFAALIFLRPLGGFLKIDDLTTILILGVYMCLIVINSSLMGALLGIQNFKQMAIITIIDMVLKLTFGVALIKFGMGTQGALIGLLIGIITSICLGILVLKKVFKEKIEKIKIHFNWKEFAGVVIATSSLNLLFIVDLILAKHYLNDINAGIYSSLSILGRVLFFLSLSIGNVLIPLTVASKKKNGNYKKNFLIIFSLVAVIELTVVIFYFVFPDFTIKLLYGDSFSEASAYLGKFAFAMFGLSMANLIHNYLIALNYRKHAIFAFIAIISQIVLLYFYHGTIGNFVNIQLLILTSIFVIFGINLIVVSYLKKER